MARKPGALRLRAVASQGYFRSSGAVVLGALARALAAVPGVALLRHEIAAILPDRQLALGDVAEHGVGHGELRYLRPGLQDHVAHRHRLEALDFGRPRRAEVDLPHAGGDLF